MEKFAKKIVKMLRKIHNLGNYFKNLKKDTNRTGFKDFYCCRPSPGYERSGKIQKVCLNRQKVGEIQKAGKTL
jgi:hypothetical protein